MPQADQATIDLLTDYFDAMEAKDSARLGSYYADNITLTFANAPTITGRDAMLEQMTTLLGKVKSLAHPLINVWQEDGGVLIFEVTSIWHLHNDTVIKINAYSIFTLADGKFTPNASTSTTPLSMPSSANQRRKGPLVAPAVRPHRLVGRASFAPAALPCLCRFRPVTELSGSSNSQKCRCPVGDPVTRQLMCDAVPPGDAHRWSRKWWQRSAVAGP
jgi:ketosteroid isomerase-like protein